MGPASSSKKVLVRMAEAGMDMVRLNMSWGTRERGEEYIRTIREAEAEVGKTLPIIMDLSGPRIKEESSHHVDHTAAVIVTDKDKDDIVFGISLQVDYFAMSYVKNAEDIVSVKNMIQREGGSAKVIAKIERKEAVENFEAIAAVSDMVMIARGDLGNEYPLGEIPFVEKDLLDRSRAVGIPVIVATQMLLSTTYQEIPSRAEVTDEVFAIINGADAVMLSEETSTGNFPVEATASMEEIAFRTEHHKEYQHEN